MAQVYLPFIQVRTKVEKDLYQQKQFRAAFLLPFGGGFRGQFLFTCIFKETKKSSGLKGTTFSLRNVAKIVLFKCLALSHRVSPD